MGRNCQLAKGEAWPRRLMLPALSFVDLANVVEKYSNPFRRIPEPCRCQVAYTQDVEAA